MAGPGGLRILHVFRSPVGGLFRHVLDLARAQAERGHAVGLFCDSSTGGERAEAQLAELAPHLALGIARTAMPRAPGIADLRLIVELRRACARLGPDVLHGHGAKGGAYSRLAALGAGRTKPLRVYTPHGGSFHFAPGTLAHRAFMAAERFLAGRTDLFLFESAYVAERFGSFVGATNGLIRIVHNGVGEDEFAPVERVRDAFDLLFIGELRPEKGLDTLIDAVAVLRHAQGIRLTLLVVGAGRSEAAFKDQARAAGIWDSVAFVPPQPIRAALERARLMVVPSRAESLPYVVLEAAAAMQPLVATAVGGIPEIFGPLAAELVPPGDAEALAKAIRRKLDATEAERDATGRLLRDRIRAGFSITAMVEGIMTAYREAAAARAGTRALAPPIVKGSLNRPS